MHMEPRSPLIGMSEVIPNLTIEKYQSIIYDAYFLKHAIPCESVKVDGPYGNSIHIQVEDQVPGDFLKLETITIGMDAEFIFEQVDPTIWDFYTLHNSLFNKFEGRIRIRPEGKGMKIGLYFHEIDPRENLLDRFDQTQIQGLIRFRVRQFFQNLGEFINNPKFLLDKIQAEENRS